MTNEEALETINTLPIVREEQGKEVKSSIAEALNVAVKALEKQIPKKPTHSCCSRCTWSFVGNWEEYEYCPHCGQCIDWSKMTNIEILKQLYQVVAPEYREAVAEGIIALEKLEEEDGQ